MRVSAQVSEILSAQVRALPARWQGPASNGSIFAINGQKQPKQIDVSPPKPSVSSLKFTHRLDNCEVHRSGKSQVPDIANMMSCFKTI